MKSFLILFNELSERGKIEMPVAAGPFGAYSEIFAVKYGIQWMVNFTQN